MSLNDKNTGCSEEDLGIKDMVYSYMSNFWIENSVLIDYLGKGGKVIIPYEAVDIGEAAFCNDKSVTSVINHNNLKIIDKAAFKGCESLADINIPDGVRSIGDEAFYGCIALTSLVIPDSVKNIGEKAFDGCPGLTLYLSMGSYAERYAIKYGLTYKIAPEPGAIPPVGV